MQLQGPPLCGLRAIVVFLKGTEELVCLFFFLSWIISEILEFQSQKGVLKAQTQLSIHSPCSNISDSVNQS